MSEADFKASGLDRLSAEQRAHLDAWLGNHGECKKMVRAADGSTEFYASDAERTAFESRISGTFHGWRGKSVFRLDNGQEWRQAESGSYDAGTLQNPEVKIKPMLLGGWMMVVKKCGCSVRVQRVK